MTRHPCQDCGKQNKRWPSGLCAGCSEKQREIEAAYEDACNHSAYLSYLAHKMMR